MDRDLQREEIITAIINRLHEKGGVKHATDLFLDEELLRFDYQRLKDVVQYMKLKDMISGINYMGADEMLISLTNSMKINLEEHRTYENYLKFLKSREKKKLFSTWVKVAYSLVTLGISVWAVLVTIQSSKKDEEIERLKKTIESQEFVIKSLQAVKKPSV